MHEYDITLKNVLQRLPPGSVLSEWTGLAVAHWLNSALPEVRTLSVDMLGETAGGELVHLELQSGNDSAMAFRMAEYSLAIRRRYGRFPRQMVLYVGQRPMRMQTRLDGTGWYFDCRIVDIRDLDAARLLESTHLEDNIVAILAGSRDQAWTIRRILERIGVSPGSERDLALTELMLLAGLRKAGAIIEQEIHRMPILDDIMDHEVIGRERRYGMALGREEGLQEGLEQGREQGRREAVTLFLRMVAERFGELPEWATTRITGMPLSELEALAPRLFHASTLQDLLG